MKFCPKCDVRLKKNDASTVSCPKCGYSESNSQGTKKEHEEETSSEFNVLR